MARRAAPAAEELDYLAGADWWERDVRAVRLLAESAARAAGGLVAREVGAALLDTKANARDLLTEVDPAAQAIVEDAVRARFPEHGFLGEESVPGGKDASAGALEAVLAEAPDWLWIVDPLDGTTNFVSELPLCAVSVAVAYKNELVVGVIYDPFRNELFSAAKGGGCTLNGSPIRVDAAAESAGSAVVATGYAPYEDAVEQFSAGVAALARLPVRAVRMIGTAALMFAWVACGRFTAYCEADLNSWDIAAGALLVQEAGGTVSGLDGSEYTLRTRAVLASNGKTHEELLETLQSAGCVGLR